MADILGQFVIPPQANPLVADQHLIHDLHRRTEIAHPSIQLECQRIQGRHIVDIRRRGDNRVGAQHACKITRQRIRPPCVAGEQADDMLGTFINDHHRRIAKFIVDQRGQYAHRNAGRPDKNQRRIIHKRFAGGIGKAVFKGNKPLLQQLFTGKTGDRQHSRQTFRQHNAAWRQAKKRN